MTKILITGGTGLVGKRLSAKLIDKGYDVAILSRVKSDNGTIRSYYWNARENEIEAAALQNTSCIIHLAGANINEKRWTPERKQLIVDSRVNTGKLIYKKLSERKHGVKTFISASAVGYYGAITSEKIYTEQAPPANDFLGETCRKWEQMAEKFSSLNIRTVKIRTGAVLSDKGGALPKLVTPVKTGLGAALGSGKQYIPWIHLEDLCNIYIKAVEDSKMEGAYNAVAPDYKTNKDFNLIIGQLLKMPLWLPNIPAFILKIIFGELAELFLEGSRVSSQKIREAGYIFLYPNLRGALINLLKKQ